MKLSFNLGLAIFMCLPLIFACKKSDDSSEKPVVPKKVLSRIIQVDFDNKTSFTTFSYDEKIRLKDVTNAGKTDTYKYDGENLFYTEFWIGTNKTVNTISYQDGKPIQTIRKAFNSGTLTKEMTIGYVYGNGPYPTEIHVKEDGIVMAINKMQYSANNNVIRIESLTNESIITENTYDTKQNKFSNTMLGFTIYGEPFDRLSPNNVLKRKVTYPDGSYLEITNTYTYDADGFPITLASKAVHSLAGDVGTYKYTYEYIMI